MPPKGNKRARLDALDNPRPARVSFASRHLAGSRKATKDTDSDGVPDIWGTGATAWGNEAISNGLQFVGEVNGKWQMTIDSDAGIRALQFLYDMNYGDGTRDGT